LAVDRCKEPQELLEVGPDHFSRCWRSATGELVTGLAAGE
jgi:hypothetical protein